MHEWEIHVRARTHIDKQSVRVRSEIYSTFSLEAAWAVALIQKQAWPVKRLGWPGLFLPGSLLLAPSPSFESGKKKAFSTLWLPSRLRTKVSVNLLCAAVAWACLSPIWHGTRHGRCCSHDSPETSCSSLQNRIPKQGRTFAALPISRDSLGPKKIVLSPLLKSPSSHSPAKVLLMIFCHEIYLLQVFLLNIYKIKKNWGCSKADCHVCGGWSFGWLFSSRNFLGGPEWMWRPMGQAALSPICHPSRCNLWALLSVPQWVSSLPAQCRVFPGSCISLGPRSAVANVLFPLCFSWLGACSASLLEVCQSDVNKVSLSQVGDALWPQVPLNEPHTTGHATEEVCVHVCAPVTWDNGGFIWNNKKKSLLEEELTSGLTVEVWVVYGQGETSRDRVLCRTWPPPHHENSKQSSEHSNPLSMDGKLYFIETGKN